MNAKSYCLASALMAIVTTVGFFSGHQVGQNRANLHLQEEIDCYERAIERERVVVANLQQEVAQEKSRLRVTPDQKKPEWMLAEKPPVAVFHHMPWPKEELEEIRTRPTVIEEDDE